MLTLDSDPDIISFGKYKGRDYHKINDNDYLLWYILQDKLDENHRMDVTAFLAHNYVMPFGRHKDKSIDSVIYESNDRMYLEWLEKNTKKEGLQKVINLALELSEP